MTNEEMMTIGVDTRDWKLPLFYCPIESPVHPSVDRIEERAIAWLDGTGILSSAADRAWNIATRSAELSCRMAPYADEERLLLHSLWNYFSFILDDTRFDTAPKSAPVTDTIDFAFRLLRSLVAPDATMLGDGPVGRAFVDLVSRTRSTTTPVHFNRLVEGVRDLLFHATWLNSRAEAAMMPTLDEYVSARISDNAGQYSSAFLEIVNGIELSDTELHADAVRALNECASFVSSLDNDFFSYPKEVDQHGFGLNIITVLTHQREYSRDKAAQEALAIRDRAMALFLRLRVQVSKGASPDLLRYLEGLGHYIAGNIHWASTAPRYAQPRIGDEFPSTGAPSPVRWSAEPSDPDPRPLPIAGISWWWNHLETH